MAQITIIPSDGKVGINGIFHDVDLSGIDADIHAIQFNDQSGVGHVEYVNNVKPNLDIGASHFDGAFGKYVAAWNVANSPVVRTLAEIKADACAQIDSARDTQEQTAFPYMGTTFDSDRASVARITVAAQAALAAQATGQDFSIVWTDATNNPVEMTSTDMIGMPVALAISANALHVKARSLKNQIDAATTAAEVEAIHW